MKFSGCLVMRSSYFFGHYANRILFALTFLATSWRSAASFAPPHFTANTYHTTLSAKQEATFGMGCFWAPSERLLKKDGVVDTVVGYTGNPSSQSPPTYDSVCFGRDWVEGVRVLYDDSQITYQELLDEFFQAQEPKLGSRQYASIIFPHSDEQERIAQEWKRQTNINMTRQDGVSMKMTSIEPLSSFYQAEGYHQRYWQKMRPRFAAAAALLAVASGVLDSVVPIDFQSGLRTAANGAILLGCVYILLERKLDAKVIKLES